MYGCHQQTKRGRLKEQSCPYIMFWCWWQYTCRGLTMFVKWISGLSPWIIKGVWIMNIRSWFYSRKKYQNDCIFGFLSIGSCTIKRGSIGLVKGLLLPQTSLPYTHMLHLHAFVYGLSDVRASHRISGLIAAYLGLAIQKALLCCAACRMSGRLCQMPGLPVPFGFPGLPTGCPTCALLRAFLIW